MQFLTVVLHLKKWLTVCYGELHRHRARMEHIAVHCNVVAEDLGVGCRVEKSQFFKWLI